MLLFPLILVLTTYYLLPTTCHLLPLTSTYYYYYYYDYNDDDDDYYYYFLLLLSTIYYYLLFSHSESPRVLFTPTCNYLVLNSYISDLLTYYNVAGQPLNSQVAGRLPSPATVEMISTAGRPIPGLPAGRQRSSRPVCRQFLACCSTSERDGKVPVDLADFLGIDRAAVEQGVENLRTLRCYSV